MRKVCITSYTFHHLTNGGEGKHNYDKNESRI